MSWGAKDWLVAASLGGAGILLGILLKRGSRPRPPTAILPPLGSLERMEPGTEIPREKHCDCEIRLLKSKGGSTRYAAVCASSPIPRYVKKEFAEEMRGKKFCTDLLPASDRERSAQLEPGLLKPFSPLSGRWAAGRRWGPYHRRLEALKRGAYK